MPSGAKALSSPAATPAHHPSFRFGRFELQPAQRRLLEDGRAVALGARAFDLLVMLVDRAGQLVALDIAVNSATEFRDGVWWVERPALSDGALVSSAIARALGVQLPGDRPPVEAITSLLAPQRLLLVLDNCEHLGESVAEL